MILTEMHRLAELRGADAEAMIGHVTRERQDGTAPVRSPRRPPRWFVRTAWVVHRGIYRVSGGRLGLRRPSPAVFGMMRLHTVGRKSGQPRVVILSYLEDGPDLITMAMNGWEEPPPAWWLNLQAHPEASVDLPDGTRKVRAREAKGAEHDRLWAKYAALEQGGADLDAHARQRTRATPVVVLEPLAS